MRHKKIKSNVKKTVLLGMIAALTAASIGYKASATSDTTDTGGGTDATQDNKAGTSASVFADYSGERISTVYSVMSAKYSLSDYTGSELVFPAGDSTPEDSKALLSDDVQGYTKGNKVLKVSAGDKVQLEVDVPQDGLYCAKLDYLSYDESILPVKASMSVDGEFPFYESRNLEFDTTWRLNDEPSYDRYDNETVTVPKGKMQRADGDIFSFEAFSLDATVFESNGKYYYIWAEKVSVGPQISNLYIAEMESGYKLKTVQVLLTTPDYDWERIGFWVNEGPAVIKRGGKVYVTYSASDTGVNYCMGMLTADENSDLLDPLSWKKERYPVLKTNNELEIYGPGHNSFTVDEDGNDILVYHARKEKEITGNPLYNPNRHAMLMKIKWDAENRPVFSYDN